MSPITSVVLIDDDYDDHEIFSIALQEAMPSITCFYFDSGKTALQKLTEEQLVPDYIFLDLNMPGMTGIQFLETIKKIEPVSKIPIVVYSTSILPQEQEKVMQLGAHHFLIKPSSHTELIGILKAFFRN